LPLLHPAKGHGGRIRPRREELDDAFHVGGDHRQMKLDLHLGQGPVPRPGEAMKILEFGHLGLDPAALALVGRIQRFDLLPPGGCPRRFLLRMMAERISVLFKR